MLAHVQSTPGQQHNVFVSNAAVTPQQIVIRLRRARFIVLTGLRNLELI
jgi:hypothetical protein